MTLADFVTVISVVYFIGGRQLTILISAVYTVVFITKSDIEVCRQIPLIALNLSGKSNQKDS